MKKVKTLQPVARFSSLRATQLKPTTWEAIYREITDGTHKAATLQYRKHLATLPAIEASGDPELLKRWKLTKSNLKNAQPAFIPSVQLEGGRTNANITGFTGLIMVDIDGLPAGRFDTLLQTVKDDPHSLLVHTTISGRGIRVISRVEGTVDQDNYRMVWEAVNAHYADLCDVKIDKQCKNPTRMSVLCHDPGAQFRPDATPFDTATMAPPKKASRRGAATPARAYKAIRRRLEEEGVDYAPGSHNAYVSRCLYQMNRYGVSREDARTWATRTFPDYPREELLAIVKSCYAQTAEFGTEQLPPAPRTAQGDNATRQKRATVEEMENFISSYMEIRMNTLTQQVETRLLEPTDAAPARHIRWERLTDHTENSLWCAMQHQGMNVSLYDLHTLLGSDFVKSFNPLRHYLDNLPPWDGQTDYIGRLAEMVHVKKTEGPALADFPHILRRWLVSMIAGALDERVVNQVILVLIGPQGSYKTSFMQHLLPPPLADYYTMKSNSARITKDDRFTMTENLIINLEEIDTMAPTELNQLKAMVTQRYVDDRPAYGRHKVHLPHIASFVGTGNNLQFLTDETGNRRWIPFEVDHIDSPWEADIPYEGIYSQAYALYHDTRFRYWFTDREVQELSSHVRQFEVPHPEYELIQTYYRKPAGLERGIYLTSSQIVNRLGSASLRLTPQKVGRAMRELGFQLVRSANVNYWVVVERTADEVQHLLPHEAENQQKES